MRSFVGQVAQSLYNRFGDDVSTLRIVFPSKRARLFFNEELKSHIEKPMWQPSYISIDDMLHGLSALRKADELLLVAELYNIYNRYHAEPFDRFYPWGKMLLADFDTIDKYMINALELYQNVSDLKQIDNYFADREESSDHERELVRTFWRTFNTAQVKSAEQRSFLRVWESLGEIYTLFRERLREQGLCYPGMMYRELAESLDPKRDCSFATDATYCFVGFNALNECEKRIFSYMKRQNGALFFWDYDNYFMEDTNQEAGRFIRRNIALWGESEILSNDNFSHPKDIEVVSSPSDIMQCKVLYRKLEELFLEQGFVDKETAVVLTDENLLTTVLNSIPKQIERINITMGYPLSSTIPYLLTEQILRLYNRRREGRFYHSDLTALLNHTYLKSVEAERLLKELATRGEIYVEPSTLATSDEVLSCLFRPVESVDQLSMQLVEILEMCQRRNQAESEYAREQREFIYLIIRSLLKFRNTIERCTITLSGGMYASLVGQMLRAQRIPYNGEPLGGLQIMGILETRNVDFKNIIFLSVTDDNFPGNLASTSYIPFNLRLAFGMPTPTDHEAMYAYYFYRAISRAQRVVMAYCSASEEMRTGEPSRYIYQLDYESPHLVHRSSVNLIITPAPIATMSAPKDESVLKKLASKRFSPSQINRYLECPFRFYLNDIEYIKIDDSEPEEEMSRMDMGTTLHRTMEMLYTPLLGKVSPQGEIARMVEDRAMVVDTVNRAFAEVMASRAEGLPSQGQLRIVRGILTRFTDRILRYDAAQSDVFIIEALEEPIEMEVDLGNDIKIRMKGTADRLDRLQGGDLRIIDYKSGGDDLWFQNVAQLFTNGYIPRGSDVLKYKKRNSAALQTLIYALMFSQKRGVDAIPNLYVAPRMWQSDFSPLLVQGSKAMSCLDHDTVNQLKEALRDMFKEIFDPEIDFVQSQFIESCTYCDFRKLCKRV